MTKPAPATVMSDATPTKVETAVKAAEPEIMTRRDLDAAIAKVVELPPPRSNRQRPSRKRQPKLEPAKTEAPKSGNRKS